MEQVLNDCISQLDIKDGERKRTINAISQEDDSNPELKKIEENLRRSSRNRVRTTELENRRVISKPKKLLDCNSKDVINYYLDKRIKRLHPSLETIFEDPKSENMSSRKFKRLINFPKTVGLKNKLKVKKRAMKAKKVPSRPKPKITMDVLLKKLSGIEENVSTVTN